MLHDSLLQVRAERVIDHPQDGIELHRRQGLGQVVEGQVNRRIRYALGIDRGGVPGDGQEGEVRAVRRQQQRRVNLVQRDDGRL
jgi:FixJ family two-component response regulator